MVVLISAHLLVLHSVWREPCELYLALPMQRMHFWDSWRADSSTHTRGEHNVVNLRSIKPPCEEIEGGRGDGEREEGMGEKEGGGGYFNVCNALPWCLSMVVFYGYLRLKTKQDDKQKTHRERN